MSVHEHRHFALVTLQAADGKSFPVRVERRRTDAMTALAACRQLRADIGPEKFKSGKYMVLHVH